MDKRDVAGIRALKFAVVDPTNNAISLHQHPDAAQRFIDDSPRNDLEAVELISVVSYLQR